MKFLKEIYPYIIAIIVVLLIRNFIATPVRVKGESMVPTFSGGEILLLSKISDVDRYDVVVLDRESNNDHLIKRIYGLPGEKISAKNNKIYINGKVIKDEYGSGKTKDFATITLAEDEYFVLGDNRGVSLDSRGLGPIKKNNISGKVVFSIFPFKKIES